MTCHKHLLRNKTPRQAVCNKLEIGGIPQVFQDLRRLEKVLISKRILSKKIAIMHGKGEFSIIKGNIVNVPVDTENICNILPRSCDSNGLIIVKLKRHMKYRGHPFFEPVRPSMIYEALEYLKTHNMFYEDIIISLGLTNDETLDFSNLFVTQSISGILEDENFEEAEDPGNLSWIATNETSLISEVPHLVNENKIILAPGQNKAPLSILSDDHCEEVAFPHLFPNGNLDTG